MEKKYSLHIGVDQFDEQAFHQRNLPQIPSQANVTSEIVQFAQRNNYQSEVLINEQATAYNVKRQLKQYSQRLKANDEFLLTFSGFVFIAPDSARHENKGQDWCLYDQAFSDDELLRLWELFPKGVKILVMSTEA